MKEADPPVTEVVGTEGRDPGGSASASDRGPETIGTRSWKESRVRIAILARRQRHFDRIREDVREFDPEGSTLFLRRRSESDATGGFVVVPDAEMLDRRKTRSGPVEPEERETVGGREESEDRLDVFRRRRLRLDRFLVGEADTSTRGIRIHLRVV